MNDKLLEQEVENIRSEVVSRFFIDYIGFLITTSLLIFILPLLICPFLFFLVTSIWGIIFLLVLSMIISFYSCISYSKQKIISRVKNLFLNTGLVYDNLRGTKNPNPNYILERLVEIDLDYNYISSGNMYNLVHTGYNESVYSGIVYLSKMNYNSYEAYYYDDSPKYRKQGFKYVTLPGLKTQLMYSEPSNIKTAIVFVVPEILFNSEKVEKEGIKYRKVGNDYVVLIEDEYVFNRVEKRLNNSENNKEQKINIDIFKKIDRDTILKIMESTLKEIAEIVNIIKGRGIIKCL
ncbi:MAG: hypothetical protein RMJ51_06155 [Candidatus Calescibacterium sp.]|nr:hypothetical protein [Candidatus Calescibacterium sp.]MCX7972565.1 hypothetical protein [bacterium]MDW8195800.1 hypothetical protein [Candidatus Calescibacterium sp.]